MVIGAMLLSRYAKEGKPNQKTEDGRQRTDDPASPERLRRAGREQVAEGGGWKISGSDQSVCPTQRATRNAKLVTRNPQLVTRNRLSFFAHPFFDSHSGGPAQKNFCIVVTGEIHSEQKHQMGQPV